MLTTTLFLHVFAGTLSLLTGFLVLLLKKGTNAHNRLGWVYFSSMLLVFMSSTIVSAYKNNIFLLLIGFFSFYLVHTGIRYRYIRNVDSIKPSDRFVTLCYGLIYFFMLTYSMYAFVKGANQLGIILSAFGLIGALLWKNDLKYIWLKKQVSSQYWLGEHIGRMIGSYIAAFTAFAVNNIRIEPSVIIWLGPTLLGFPLIFYFNRKYLRGIS